MQNLGLWGYVSPLLQKQHDTVFLVVKSYKMWVSGGISTYFSMQVVERVQRSATSKVPLINGGCCIQRNSFDQLRRAAAVHLPALKLPVSLKTSVTSGRMRPNM